MVTAKSASRASPSSARSATKRSRSKFMFAPLSTATSGLSRVASLLDVRLESGNRQRAGRLDDAARVLEHVFDRRADLVVRHPDDRRRPPPARAETCGVRPGARRRHRRRGRMRSTARAARPPAPAHIASESMGSTPNDANRRHERLDVGRDAREQSAAADGNEDGAELAGPLPENLVADGGLSRNHARIVVRVDERGRAGPRAASAPRPRRQRSGRRPARPRRRARAPHRP